MKLQFGLFNITGQPVSPDDFSRFAGEYATYPAEIAGEVNDGPVMMGYRGDRITYEEDYEVQPVRLGALVMTWDGRLDNRRELADRIRLNNIESIPDPEIILKAYQALGDRIFDDLIGEFALVLWNKSDRRLQFARSVCGARTLYYVLTKNSLIWSSDFAHLVRVSGVDLKVNDGYVFDYFVSEPDTNQTGLSSVQAASPNTVRTFESGRCSSARELWDPTRIRPLSYSSDGEYEEACREQIKNAVGARLRCKLPICAELSGGLDSSTIVLTADQLLREHGQFGSSLHTVSCVYNQSETCDESGFIFAVTQKRAIETHLISEKDQRITLGLDEDPPFTGPPNPLHCLPGRYEAITKVMREQGARVLLTGIGGDHLFLSDPNGAPLVADQIRKANFIRAHRECEAWSRVTCAPYYRTAKQAVRLALDSLFPGDALYIEPEIPTWINASLHSTPFSPRVEFSQYRTWRAAPSRRVRVFLADHLLHLTGSGFLNEYQQLYISHPFSHRPLIEFCLGIPISQFLRDGHTRSLLRRIGVLPPKNAKRVSKGLLGETVLRAVRREWHSLGDLKKWKVCQRGYAEPVELEKTLNRTHSGFLDLSGSLFRLFSIERWLRSLGHVRKHPSSDIPEFSLRMNFGVSASSEEVTK